MSWPHIALAVVSVGVIGLTALLSRSHAARFELYFGPVDPVVAVAVVAASGVLSLAVLQSRGWFAIVMTPLDLRGFAAAAVLATSFAGVAMIADLAIRFPPDTHVRPPAALAFYPAMGYVAEIVFHVLPLTVLLVALSALVDEAAGPRLLWPVIVVVAVLEPTFQVSFMDRPLSWAGAFVWLHLTALNLAQLALFRRYDFASMYAFRLVYYLCWHIVWGVVRRHVLF